ncbi:MAG: hypothetical protein QW727_03610 [Candidatus Pacearchaeota archaeon]
MERNDSRKISEVLARLEGMGLKVDPDELSQRFGLDDVYKEIGYKSGKRE